MREGDRKIARRPGPRSRVLVIALLLGVVAGIGGVAQAGPSRADVSRPAASTMGRPFNDVDRADARVAVSWFDLLYHLIQVEKLSPPVASRIIGYAGVGLYESIVPGMPDHRSLAGQLNALPPIPAPDPRRKCHWPLAANAAAAGVIRGMFAAASPDSKSAIDALEQHLAAEVGRNVPPPVRDRSHDWGGSVAHAILDWAATDGIGQLNNCAYTPPVGAGLWVPTPPAFRPPLQPCWGQMRPFVLSSGTECGAPPHPAFSTDPASDFYHEGFEVYDTVNHLTDEQRAIMLFWADNPAETGTPPGHWISITGQIARQQHLSLAQAGEAYARVGIAVADAFISCWQTKYTFNLLRPVTYIQQNIDAIWLPPLATPAFPEYTSGHSVQSGAAASVLTDQLGDVHFTDTTHVNRGLPARSFDSFDQAAQEAAMSRLYGGIHYRSAIERGIEQGECIGGRILDRVQFSQPAD